MNKEQILDCFESRKADNKIIKTLTSKYAYYFSKDSQMPENFRAVSEMNSTSYSKQSSEMGETISFYSALSRLTIDQSLLDDVQVNARNHNPFSVIEEDKDESFKWYYQLKNDEIHGPLKAKEMDSRYKLGKFGKNTKVKTRQDDSYYPFVNLLKRYCKILKTKKLNMPTEPKILSNKIKHFKKGELAFRQKTVLPVNDYNGEYVQASKGDRTRTYAPKPNLNWGLLMGKAYKAKTKPEVDEDEFDEIPETRERAKTHV